MTAELRPWDRQSTDTEASWRAFESFREMHTPRRFHIPGVATADLQRWSRDHAWIARVAAYDAHLDQIRQEEKEGVLRQTTRDIQARHMTILLDMRELVAREAAKKLEESRTAGAMGTLKVREIKELADLVFKMERLILDQPTENIAVSWDLTRLSQSEFETFHDIVRKVTKAKE